MTHMNGKRISFMPFLPRRLSRSRKMMLEFRMVDKPHEVSWRTVHEISRNAIHQPAKDDDDEMIVKDEDMKVTCKLHDDATLEKHIETHYLRKSKHTVYFDLDFTGKEDDLPVKLELIQSHPGMEIQFRTSFVALEGSMESIEAAASVSSQGSVTEKSLRKLAVHIPSADYSYLSFMLGIEFDPATNILHKHNKDCGSAMRECLQIWKNRTGGSIDDLTKILKSSGLKDKVRYVNPP